MRFTLAASMMVALAVPVAAAEHAERTVPWTNADAHVGTIVVIEGFVREVRREGRRVTLLFDPDDARALRVTLLIPLVTDLPPEPETLYRERRIQARGRVTRTAGHLDLIVTDPDRITVAGLTPDGSTPAVDAIVPAPPGRAAPAFGPDDARPSPEATARPRPSPRAAAAARTAAACARLTASRDTARREALDAVARLRACLEGGHPGCSSETDAIAPPVTRLEWIEQELRERCSSDP